MRIMLIVDIHIFCVCTASLFFNKFSDPSVYSPCSRFTKPAFFLINLLQRQKKKDDTFICISASLLHLNKRRWTNETK